MGPVNSTGFVKAGDQYINPAYITRIVKKTDHTTLVEYSVTEDTGAHGIHHLSDCIRVDGDKFAQCAVQAMQTGKIVDVFV